MSNLRGLVSFSRQIANMDVRRVRFSRRSNYPYMINFVPHELKDGRIEGKIVEIKFAHNHDPGVVVIG